MEWIYEFEETLMEFLNGLGIWAPFLSCIFIFLEGILAFLPLFVFVTVNILSMSSLVGSFLGSILGIVLSWIFCVFGSFTMFLGTRRLFGKKFRNKIAKNIKANKFMNIIDKLSYSQIVLIVSIPFSPSFFINLGSGLSKINEKKYFFALLVGKFAEMIFLGYVGVSLIECLTQPLALIKVAIIMIVGYLFSIGINKKFNLDERFE